MPNAFYIGRFAPSPTGPLHFGSLVAALASYLDARTLQGSWLLRVEDLDPPRCVPGSVDSILYTLEAFGFSWDGPVVYQSTRLELYEEALDRLREAALVFACGCTRKEVGDGPYPGTCRRGLAGKAARAYRLLVNRDPIRWQDRLQGEHFSNLEEDCGDFVLLRADGIWAYQLAVVVDDHLQGVTDVVRGADLLDSTARQIYLQRCLGYRQPRYLHIPAATNAWGEKLSKQTLAPALDPKQAGNQLWQALAFLGQDPPSALFNAPLKELWPWALAHWKAEQIPPQRCCPIA